MIRYAVVRRGQHYKVVAEWHAASDLTRTYYDRASRVADYLNIRLMRNVK